MRRLRFYCESIDTESVLDPLESNHLSRVMRVSVGQTVELFDGKGTFAEGVVQDIHKKQATIKSHKIEHFCPTTNFRTILAVSFAKSQRFDWIVEKCTELGVDHIAAVQFDRTVKQGSRNAIERYRKISIAAAKQCGRLFLPDITGPAAFTDTLEDLQNRYPSSTRYYGDPAGTHLCKAISQDNPADRIVFIGPEGGFTDAEIAMLDTAGAVGVSVNNNVLRIETAAIGFCAILNALNFQQSC